MASTFFKRKVYLATIIVVYMLGSIVVRHHFIPINGDGSLENNGLNHGQSLRKLLSVKDGGNATNLTRCTKPSIEEFPRDLFTQQQRRYGAVLLHVFLAIYMFIALALVCDEYFVSSLEKICEHFDLSEDVAGATFMAAGSSAPELFTAIISVFIAKGDVGLGTIVGSAVFNILVIIALCSLFAGQVIQLSWWPLCRDSFFYSLAIAALLFSLQDGFVSWYESVFMMLLYAGYIALMKFNPKIVTCMNKRRHLRKMKKTLAVTNQNDVENNISVTYVDGKYTENGDDAVCSDQVEMENRKRVSWKELAYMMMLTDKFSPTTRFRAACLMVLHREEHKKLLQQNADTSKENGTGGHAEKSVTPTDGDDVEPESILVIPTGSIFKIIYWVISFPLAFVMFVTIPDCRKEKWEKWWLVTFIMSIVWIMIFSYIMVWMVSMVGYTIGVPDVIMGIIFLAAGTSIPDAISSLIVAREGMGDMAVSNSIGSNIFDILIGLALPWFIKTAIHNPGISVQINSRGMLYSVVLLFASLILTVFSIYMNKWCLDRKLGLMLTGLYFVFITLSACIEFNVFTFVNFPICPFDG